MNSTSNPTGINDLRFRAIVENAGIGVALVGPSGQILHANPRLCEMFGYSFDQFVTKNIVEITHPDDVTVDVEFLEEMVRGERDSYRLEKRYFRADGSLLYGRLTTSTVRRADGSMEFGIGMVEDISELHQLSHAFGERVKELNALHALSRRLLRHGPEDMHQLLQDVADLLPPAFQFPHMTSARVKVGNTHAVTEGFGEGYATLRTEWAAAIAPAGSIEVQYASAAPQAAEGPFLAEERSLIDSVGDLLRIATIGMREAEARDAAQQALHFSEGRLQVALEAARMGTIEWDLTTEMAKISEVSRQIFDFPVGTTIVSIPEFRTRIHPDDRLKVRLAFRDELKGKPSKELEYRLLLPTGVLRHVAVRARVFFNDQGVAIRRSGVIVDVTSRHVLEEQFRQAQKMEAVGRLAGGVAHDFNNLLTVIGAAAEFAHMATEQGSQLHADVQDIVDSVSRARSLTTQLLTFSRRQVVRPTLLNLSDVVRSTDKMLRRLLGADISLLLQLSKDMDQILADAGQIEQVLVNLLVNARDAMPTGGTISIATSMVTVDEAVAEIRRDLTPGTYATMSVSDTGSGMDDLTCAQIFEPFFTTKEAGRGTGLGLATVFGIVKQAGGNIFVYSEQGLGSTFRIYLPRNTSAISQTGEFAVPAAASTGGNETVLLVEDEPHVRLLARRILTEQGYEVLEAGTGLEAMDIARDYPSEIHLLVSDVVLPERNGREVADTLLQARPQLKILFMSGYTADALLHHRITEAGTPFIEKPFTRSALAAAVRAALDGPRR